MLTVGDIVPPTDLVAEDGSPLNLIADNLAGNYTILILCADIAAANAIAELQKFKAASDSLVAVDGLVYLIARKDAGNANVVSRDLALPFPVLNDRIGELVDAFDAGADAIKTIIIRPNNHVMAIFDATTEDHTAAALNVIRDDTENRSARFTARHPPVLMVPDVFSRKDCEHLISVFNFDGHVWLDPGHGPPPADITTDYKMKTPDYGREDRIDHRIVNPKTAEFVTSRLRTRLFPEIKKAFHYQITHFERYRIGSYKGERHGDAHGHRDNTDEFVANRRFAVSINLNSEQFEGGGLRFPEFGGHQYRPETGEAIVFSSSLLHEALHVTKGQRFVLLGFLLGEH
jgi:peroxiredoxin